MYVDKQLISYWLRILDKDKNTLAYITYIIVLNLFMRNEYKAHWLIKVNHILNNCGLSYMWSNQQTLHTKRCKLIIHNQLEDIAMHKWCNIICLHLQCVLCLTCGLCNLCLPGDEYHYILICPFFYHSRKILLKPYFYNRPNIKKFNILLSSSNQNACIS